jgi:hypothetical protein
LGLAKRQFRGRLEHIVRFHAPSAKRATKQELTQRTATMTCWLARPPTRADNPGRPNNTPQRALTRQSCHKRSGNRPTTEDEERAHQQSTCDQLSAAIWWRPSSDRRSASARLTTSSPPYQPRAAMRPDCNALTYPTFSPGRFSMKSNAALSRCGTIVWFERRACSAIGLNA